MFEISNVAMVAMMADGIYEIPYPFNFETHDGQHFAQVLTVVDGAASVSSFIETDDIEGIMHIPAAFLTREAKRVMQRRCMIGGYSRPKGRRLDDGYWPVKRWEEHEFVPYEARRAKKTYSRPQPWERG